SGKPTTAAHSITAVSPSTIPYSATTERPNASTHRASTRTPSFASRTDSNVPSPPSAIGRKSTTQSASTSIIARSITPAASTDPRLPLNESGATTIRIDTTPLVKSQKLPHLQQTVSTHLKQTPS